MIMPLISATNRYAVLTVDTEALPPRATHDHVNRLIWGRFIQGTAGVCEITSVGKEFGVSHVFFVDMCGAYRYPEEMREVVRWLDRDGQDVQLHMHPEVLPEEFWISNGMNSKPTLMNEYSEDRRSAFLVSHFGGLISEITHKPLLAFRAGSFRWNASSIRALKTANIRLSFNNSMRAHRAGRCVFSEPTNLPYVWSNGVIEVPVTEKLIPPQPGGKEFWASLTYPESPYFPFKSKATSFLTNVFERTNVLSVFLLHSWSLLYSDENGHATYRDDQRLEGYRKLLARVVKDYDVITTRDFLDLYERGKIRSTHTVNVEKANFKG